MKKSEIAFVDDEPEILDLYKDFFNPTFDVRIYEGGNLLVHDLERGYSPLVVVTDLKMPGMSGLDLSQKILSLECECSVVMVSGFAERPDLIQAISSNVIGFIEKPFDPADLVEKVKRAARRQMAARGAKEFLAHLKTLSAEQSLLNTNYFQRLMKVENALVDLAPEAFGNRNFMESHLKLLEEARSLERKILEVEVQIAQTKSLLEP